MKCYKYDSIYIYIIHIYIHIFLAQVLAQGHSACMVALRSRFFFGCPELPWLVWMVRSPCQLQLVVVLGIVELFGRFFGTYQLLVLTN